MKLLLNDKEIANYLTNLVKIEIDETIKIEDKNVYEAVDYALAEKAKGMGKWNKKKHKIKDKIKTGVERDLREYLNIAKENFLSKRQTKYDLIHKNLNQLLKKLDIDLILQNYKKNTNITGFIKSTGLHIDPNAELLRRAEYHEINEDCLLRNTVGNENFLLQKIDKKLPFWFIDSGYTNFLESNKKWHRLVRSHLHIGNHFEPPADRLSVFKSFPRPWREGGDKILVIEPGNFAAEIFHVDIKKWKYSVEHELRQYTDKKIVFREKQPKKKRSPLYKHLLDEDYYCVVNINSNAATESIWAGIPVITLDTHITNTISRKKLSDINNLYTGSIANWLCMLSYSQFTYDELTNGTALNLIRKFHV
jgi:hypothetical protein